MPCMQSDILPPTLFGLDIGVLGQLWSHNDVITVETDSNLKLLPPSILDKYKMFEHIDMLPKGIR